MFLFSLSLYGKIVAAPIPLLEGYQIPSPPRAPCNGFFIRRGVKWFPDDREPFTSLEVAFHWVAELMPHRKSISHNFPSREDFVNAYKAGERVGMHNWYHQFNALVRDAVCQDRDELRIYTSLLATSSPNSTGNDGFPLFFSH